MVKKFKDIGGKILNFFHKPTKSQKSNVIHTVSPIPRTTRLVKKTIPIDPYHITPKEWKQLEAAGRVYHEKVPRRRGR